MKKTEDKKPKAFWNRRANSVLFTFPNGNSLSTVWMPGTYCDHWHSSDLDFQAFLDSDTVEIMVGSAPEKTQKSVDRALKHKSAGGLGGPYARITILEWLKVMNILAK